MPIRLAAPAPPAGGPDGRGWNRISLSAHMGSLDDQCALQPATYATLWEAQDTRRAHWGGFGRCTSDGDCGTCPLLRRAVSEPTRLDWVTDRVLVRIRTVQPAAGGPGRDEPWLMNHPDKGWASRGERWTWFDLVRLTGWRIARRHTDHHGDGFWLDRRRPAAGTAQD